MGNIILSQIPGLFLNSNHIVVVVLAVALYTGYTQVNNYVEKQHELRIMELEHRVKIKLTRLAMEQAQYEGKLKKELQLEEIKMRFEKPLLKPNSIRKSSWRKISRI